MGLPGPGLVEVVFGSGLRLGGIELSGLIEVIWRGSPGDLFRVGATEIEFSLGRSPAGWRSGGEVGSPMWARIWAMGTGSVRTAMKVRGVWQEGQIRGKTS